MKLYVGLLLVIGILACGDENTVAPEKESSSSEVSNVLSSSIDQKGSSVEENVLSSELVSSIEVSSSSLDYFERLACMKRNLTDGSITCFESPINSLNTDQCSGISGVEVVDLLSACPTDDPVPLYGCHTSLLQPDGVELTTSVYYYNLSVVLPPETLCGSAEIELFSYSSSSETEASSSSLIGVEEGKACFYEIPMVSAASCVEMASLLIKQDDCAEGLVLEACPLNPIQTCPDTSGSSTQYFYGDLYSNYDCL